MNYRSANEQEHQTLIRGLYAFGFRLKGGGGLKDTLSILQFRTYPTLILDETDKSIDATSSRAVTSGTAGQLGVLIVGSLKTGSTRKLRKIGGYDVTLTPTTLKVGCQEFPLENVKALIAAVKKV